MDDRKANIDLVFRNGLKDYEVLPPAEVWKNIHPVVRKNQQPLLILRAAAMIAVVLSLSFLAYRWSTNISTSLVNTLGMNQESETPVVDNKNIVLIADAGNIPGIIIKNQAPIPIPIQEYSNITDTVKYREIHDVVEFQSETSDLSVNIDQGTRASFNSTIRNKDYSISTKEYSLQDFSEIDAVKETQRWSVAALVSPAYYMNMKSGSNEFADQILNDDQSLMSYSGGVALSYKINNRFSVQSGLYYSTFGHELEGISAFSGFGDYNTVKGSHAFAVLTARGTVYTDNADIYLSDRLSENRVFTRYTGDILDPVKADLQNIGTSLLQSYSYLEMPIMLRYKVIDRAIDFNIIGGLSSNRLVSNSVFASSDNGKYEIGSTDGLNLWTFSSTLGMGMEYSVSRNLSLNLEPTIRYFLNSSNNIPGVKLHPYSFGVFTGLSYKF